MSDQEEINAESSTPSSKKKLKKYAAEKKLEVVAHARRLQSMLHTNFTILIEKLLEDRNAMSRP
jgi:hypothetical protein